MVTRRLASPLALALSLSFTLALSATSAQAQSQPKGSEGKVKVKKMEKLMSRDELRKCMKLQYVINAENEGNQAQLKAMRAEKDALDVISGRPAQIKVELEAEIAEVKAVDEALKPYLEVRKDLDKRAADFKEFGKNSRNAEREGKALEAGYKKLKADTDALIDKRQTHVKRYEALAKEFDTLVAERNQKAEDWNRRNSALVDAQNKVLEDQAQWNTSCKGRAYQEEDEQYIQKELNLKK